MDKECVDKVCVDKECVEQRVCGGWRRRREEAAAAAEEAGYRIKNKNPTQSCGEKHSMLPCFFFGSSKKIVHKLVKRSKIDFQKHLTSSTAQGGGGSFRIGNL